MNARPVALYDLYRTLPDVPLQIGADEGVLRNDHDPDGDALHVVSTVLTTAEGGAVTFTADGGFNYAPPLGWQGQTRFWYILSDAHGGLVTGDVRVFVGPPTVRWLPEVAQRSGAIQITAHGRAHDFNVNGLGVGDVNGDGLGDVAIAANPREIHIVFGSRNLTETGAALAAYQREHGGFSIDYDEGEGIRYSPAFFSVEVGDLNADGLGDIAVPDRYAPTSGQSFSGRTYVIFGKTSNDEVRLSDIVAGVGGFTIDGEGASYNSGASVRNLGDFDGDGSTDLAIGAPHAPNGRAYLLYGDLAGYQTPVGLANVGDGIDGFVIEGASADSEAGEIVAPVGDVNMDGYADLLVFADTGSEGVSYVVYGGPGRRSASLSLAHVSAGSGGFAFYGRGDRAGDVNGDGWTDLLLYYNDLSYIVFGTASGVYPFARSEVAAGNTGFTVEAELEVLGDINHDGRSDFASEDGYVVYGRANGRATPLGLDEIAAGIDGVFIVGDDLQGRGAKLRSAGDFNGDGMDDFVATDDDSSGIYVVFGEGSE